MRSHADSTGCYGEGSSRFAGFASMCATLSTYLCAFGGAEDARYKVDSMRSSVVGSLAAYQPRSQHTRMQDAHSWPAFCNATALPIKRFASTSFRRTSHLKLTTSTVPGNDPASSDRSAVCSATGPEGLHAPRNPGAVSFSSIHDKMAPENAVHAAKDCAAWAAI